MHTLKIRELTFSAAHYLPDHPRCGVIHGHTYFVRNLIIRYPEDKFVDFGIINGIIRGWDHCFIVPINHARYWEEVSQNWSKKLGITCVIRTIEGSPTVENIARALKEEIKLKTGADSVSFALYEGPNQGVEV